MNLSPLEEEFLRESNAIEEEYSVEALEDAKSAWEYAKANRQNINLDYTFGVHQRLLRRLNPKIAGKIRKVDVWASQEKCLAPGEISAALNEWFGEANGFKSQEAIRQRHIRFLKIHPFGDGNGRTSRMLMNAERLNSGYPILVICESESEKYFGWFK
ncbi:Fic family protein [Candidatus Pacearchaeota archaeon]|nr:Fic family protein [Candidatus Pacearchaeota archaeon]